MSGDMFYNSGMPSFPLPEEMKKLREMLKLHGIGYVEVCYFDGYQTNVEVGKKRISVICHSGSYGHQAGLLEAWDFDEDEDPEGWLKAEDAFAYIMQRIN